MDNSLFYLVFEEIIKIRKRFAKNTLLGKRRTEISEAPSASVVPLAAIIQKEPITVVCSHMGWIRTVKGHLEDFSSLKCAVYAVGGWADPYSNTILRMMSEPIFPILIKFSTLIFCDLNNFVEILSATK